MNIANTTERQRKILEIVTKEYIKSASPVSSKFIEENYDLGVSPATIRNDMQDLIEKEYLYQPHTSAGRVPTDKGYRFLVNIYELKGRVAVFDRVLEREIERMRKEVENEICFMTEFTRLVAESSSALTLSYLIKEKIFIREGWPFIFNDPEFRNARTIHNFMTMISDIERKIDKISEDEDNSVKVYIGNESPFRGRSDFTVMISPYFSKRRKKGILAILGPKRMPYEKNIKLVNSIITFLKNDG